MSPLLANLDPPQLAAVTLPLQHALILAGPGSGKTRILANRMAWLIQTGQVSPAAVLAVTFTANAADEMLTRLSAVLPVASSRMWVGTFHGLCNRLLREHCSDAALPQTFQILDSADQLAAIERLMKVRNVDHQRLPSRQLQHFINRSKGAGIRAKDIEIVDDFIRLHVELYAAYDDQCQSEGVVDFAELLLRSFEMLSHHRLLREHYQRRFAHILVEDFQDTDALQYRWLKLLAGGGASIFAVGDNEQAIYAFREANVGNMATFEREFRVTNVIKLEKNYRSRGHILQCANGLIRHNGQRLIEDHTELADGEPVQVFEAYSDVHEAQWLLKQLRALIGEGWPPAEVAVLYRTNAQSRVIEHTLFSAGLRYKVYGRLRFFQRAEVKHALAYLRLVADPNDDFAFLRAVNLPVRGIGARSLEQLQHAARLEGTSLYRAVASLSGVNADEARLAAFTQLVDELGAQARGLTLPEAVKFVIKRSGIAALYNGVAEGDERLENLRELTAVASTFLADLGKSAAAASANPIGSQKETTIEALTAFLEYAEVKGVFGSETCEPDAIKLMTVHQAHGLEFDAVFITGLEEGLFPLDSAANEPGGLEEERRLMYVAITRARRRLYLSLARTRMLNGQTRQNLRSRFFEEFPETSLKWLSPRMVGTSRAGAVRRTSKTVDLGLPFRVGQSVEHSRFGKGVVLCLEGRGEEARAQVNFGSEGVRWLALAVARLTAL
jgi:DNA helicase-2/ATP-dependent DNA helicase PcrA